LADPREAIAQALAGFLTPEQTQVLIDEILSIKKKARAEFSCKKCGARQIQFGDVADAKAVSSALTDLANQAFGRPTESAAQSDPIQFVRLTKTSELDQYTSDATTPKRAVTRNVKVRKGEVRRQSGSASRRKTPVDKQGEG
jgi:hypothetical protein